MKSLLPGILFLIILPGCASGPVNDKSAQLAYQAIEDKLLSAPVLRVDYAIEASGAVAANIAGDLVMQKPALAAIDARGVFAGSEVAPVLVSDGTWMRGGNTPNYFAQALPENLREGLLIGLMRMGILHNLANLTQAAPPDGTDGGVQVWVVANGFSWQPATRRVGDVELRGIGFSIEVGGEPAGDVVLWYDPESGLPVEREQLVHFDGGAMQVSERYTIEIDGVIGPCRFDLEAVPAVAE